MNPELAQHFCDFPERLHPVSQMFLDYYIVGKMATPEFLHLFSLPNSDYIPLGQCLITMLTTGAPGA